MGEKIAIRLHLKPLYSLMFSINNLGLSNLTNNLGLTLVVDRLQG